MFCMLERMLDTRTLKKGANKDPGDVLGSAKGIAKPKYIGIFEPYF